MDFDKNVPIYMQIMFEIKRRISTGQLNPGGKLPSVRDLAEEIKVNPNTIVRAYQELEREGVTETRRGMGTFIVDSDKNSISLQDLDNFLSNEEDDLSVEEICKEFFVSPSTLRRIMLSAYHKTPVKYITEVRLKNAKKP